MYITYLDQYKIMYITYLEYVQDYVHYLSRVYTCRIELSSTTETTYKSGVYGKYVETKKKLKKNCKIIKKKLQNFVLSQTALSFTNLIISIT